MKTITLRKYVNRYQTMEVNFESFPDHVKPREYELTGYLCGERLNKIKEMSVFDFDTIVYLKNSVNSKNEIKYIHCLGVRDDILTPIVLNRK